MPAQALNNEIMGLQSRGGKVDCRHDIEWDAPWMKGLVKRRERLLTLDGGTHRCETADSAREGLNHAVAVGSASSGGDESAGVKSCGMGKPKGSPSEGEEGTVVECLAVGDWSGSPRSDLHYEILRFVEYVSLTPSEVRTRNTAGLSKAHSPEALPDVFGVGVW